MKLYDMMYNSFISRMKGGEFELMKLMKYICIVVLVCICASFGFAKKYSDPPAGQGTSTIGIGGDYASLFECAQDFNTTANTGSWTVTILNDLYEPKNVAFGNWVLDASTILFKPAKPLTISFTTTLDNAGISGAWVIGLQELDMLYGAMDSTAISTNNFIIDGSTTAGGTDRSLTVVNSPDLVAGAFPVILAVYGACTNVQVRNCNLINAAVLPTGTHYVVNVRGRQPTMPLLYYSTTSSLAPKDFLLENCYVMSTGTPGGAGGSVCYAIQLGIHGGGAYANKPTGCTIKNCLIEARARGIHVNFHDNVTISNNTIRVRQTLTSAATPIGIAINDVAGNGIVTIANNVIDKVESSSQTGSVTTGPTGIDLSSSASPTALEAYVYNNMISGLKYVNPVTTTPQNAGIRGIVAFNAAHASSKYHIMYNSISIDSQENLGITVSSNSCFGIGLIKTAPTGARTIKNNIVRMAQPGGHCIILGNATTASNLYGYDYNNYINLNGANLGRLGSTNYTTLAAWTTALAAAGNLTGDQHSQSVDPTKTWPSAWVSITDLRFSGATANTLAPATPNLTPSPITVTTDINGDVRDAIAPWPGCDEKPQPVGFDTIRSYVISTTGTYPFYLATFGATTDYTPVTLTVKSLSTTNSITITVIDSKHPLAKDSTGLLGNQYFLSRWWNITGGDNVTDADLTVTYTDNDFADANFGARPESQIEFAKYSGGIWNWFAASTRDTNANWIKINGLNSFSDWTLSGPGGIPVELSRFETETH